MRFTWDASKATDNLKDHKIGFDEACTIFDDEWMRVRQDIVHSIDERRFIGIGCSDQNRLLIVIYTEPESDRLHIISARAATRREQEYYERQFSKRS